MKWPFVSRRYAERLEEENARLVAQNEGLIRSSFAIQGIPDPFSKPLEKRPMPILRKSAERMIKEIEASERRPAGPADN